MPMTGAALAPTVDRVSAAVDNVLGAACRLSPTAAGIAFTLASAVFYSAFGVMTQVTLDAGASVATVLSLRLLLAVAVLWPLIWAIRRRRPDRRQLLAGFALGVGFSAHAWLFSTSLTRLDAGLVDLLLFTYPALVVAGAVALRRDRWNARSAVALAITTAGTALVLAGGVGSIDPLGAVLALGAALAYAVYILSSAGQLERTDPFLLVALVTTGAAVILTVAGVVQSDVSLDIGVGGFALIAAVAFFSMAGMGTFVAGISLLGPSRASIVSAVQPALTPVLGFAAFGDRLGPAQMFGGALVVAGVVVLEARGGVLAWRSKLAWLPREERRALARVAIARDVPAGESVVMEGTPGDAFYVIERGSATVTRDANHLRGLDGGDFFGELALLNGGDRTASVVAATDMRVRVIRRRDFGTVLAKLPTLAHSVRDLAAQRLGPVEGQAAAAG
jgi:drug/metabolite transporter (DMT)-like permease